MTSFLRSDRSHAVAIWLWSVAALVLAMVAVGGATRLTGSGLSITQWKPMTGVIPPLSAADWRAAFEAYKQIPQYSLINPHMTLGDFQAIYWWEWSHRLLARVLGVTFLGPLLWFAVRRELPRRLLWQFGALMLLFALEPLVGWWMVASGLAERVSVAPERLMAHLGIALALLGSLVWTGLDAWAGSARQSLPSPWAKGALWLMGLIYAQALLGALVAGSNAGLVYNDFPLFAGRVWPQDYWAGDLWTTIAHNQGSVQLHHRVLAFVVLLAVLAAAVRARRSSYLATETKRLAGLLALAVAAQVALGISTLVLHVPTGLAMAHQALAAIALSISVALAWRVRRV